MNDVINQNIKMEWLEHISKTIASHHNIKKEKLTLDAHFKNDLGIDSLEIVELVIDIEKMFNLTISYDEQKSIETINDVLTLIEKHHG